MLRILRVFLGGYTPNQQKLKAMGYANVRLCRPFITVMTSNQGLGRIEGNVRQGGVPYSNLKVQVFHRNQKILLWETNTNINGDFKFRNISKGLECYVMVFDPMREKNAKVKDMIVAN